MYHRLVHWSTMSYGGKKIVVYVRAADVRFLESKILHADVPTWVRGIVQRSIETLKERDERSDTGGA